MTLLDLIRKASGPASELVVFLSMIADKFPDLAPRARELAAKLSEAVSVDGLVNVATALPAELARIARSDFDGRNHPSDIV